MLKLTLTYRWNILIKVRQSIVNMHHSSKKSSPTSHRYSQYVELHLPAYERVLLVDQHEPLLHEALLLLASTACGGPTQGVTVEKRLRGEIL